MSHHPYSDPLDAAFGDGVPSAPVPRDPPYLAGLNKEQREAVETVDGPVLVLAGAGTGKTRVLTTRLAHILATRRAWPGQILSVTFTNKAAREMKERIGALIGGVVEGMQWLGTFHSIGAKMLRRHAELAGLKSNFTILDSDDQLRLMKQLIDAEGIDEKRWPVRTLAALIDNWKNRGQRPDDVSDSDGQGYAFGKGKLLYRQYQERLRALNAADFGDLLLETLHILKTNPDILADYRDRFRYMLVDEYQDTNVVQYLWLKLLASQSGNVCVVGDDDQSIYAFRGASAANMQDLQRDFHIERVIRLEQNYRSHGHILDAANALIRHNRKRLGKNLWTSEGKGEPLRVYEAATDLEEAGFIVDEVKALHAEGVALHAMAMLYRSNAQSRVLEHALFSAGLPYRVYGGLRFFERQEVKHALAYLRLIANPDDDGAFLRIVNFPARGIGTRSVEQLQEWSRARGASLWAAAKEKADGASSLKGVPAFVALIERMRDATKDLPLAEAIDHVIDASGLKQHYKTEKEGTDRLENLAELVNAAATFVRERDLQPAGEGVQIDEPDELTAFLAHAALEAGEHQAIAGADALQLMTVHSAKGLEFHAVFVSGMEEGLFPHENSLTEADGI